MSFFSSSFESRCQSGLYSSEETVFCYDERSNSLWSQISFSVTVLWHCLVSEVEAEQDNPISSSFSAAWFFSKFISGTGEWFPASFKVSVLQRVNGRLWSECVSDSCLLKAEYHLCVNTLVQMDMVLVTSLWNVLLDSTLPGNKTQISIDLAFDFR